MKWLVSFVLLWLPSLTSAQCLDSLRFPQAPGTACNLQFLPVCGCNGVTYHNECFAEWGAVLQWTDRPCEQVAINLYPNPVVYQLYVEIVTRYEADVQIYIFDQNGNIYYQTYLQSVEYEYLNIPVYDFDNGLYIFVAQSGQDMVLEKFIRWSENPNTE